MQTLDRAAIRGMNQVRLVSNAGNEIISAMEAFERADGEGMDLVLVSDDAIPPVVRIQDFKKIQFEKAKARKQSHRKSSLKEVQFKANISDHDFETKLGNIRKFLTRGDKVKVIVRLKGRERETPERAQALIQRVADSVECKVNRMPGPIAIALLEPVSK